MSMDLALIRSMVTILLALVSVLTLCYELATEAGDYNDISQNFLPIEEQGPPNGEGTE